MAREEIIEKLSRFITEHNPITEECHVICIMVQIRKLLDHDQDHWQHGSFTLLRFYCDWTVHTKKDLITDSIKSVLGDVFKDVKRVVIFLVPTQKVTAPPASCHGFS